MQTQPLTISVNDDEYSSDEKKPSPPPTIRKSAIVRCLRCRCMAYQDRKGKWRDYFHHDELTDVIEVIPLD